MNSPVSATPRLTAAENIELRRFKDKNMDLIGPFIENSCMVAWHMNIQPEAILGDLPIVIDLSELRGQWKELQERARRYFGTANAKDQRMIAQMESETRSLLETAGAEGLMKPRQKERINPPAYLTGYSGR